MANLFSLTGKTALVTGAGGGLGAAIATAMAEAGAMLVVTDLTEAACAPVAEQLVAGGAQAVAIAADMSDPASRSVLIEKAHAIMGPIDVLVCNAGIEGPFGPLGAAPATALDQVFEVNLRAALDLATRVAPDMRAAGYGSIILMASIAALRGNRAIGAYSMSKAALTQLARNLAVEWGPDGIRTNAIAPGLIETPFAAELMADENFMSRRLSLTPLRRVGQPDEVAGVAVMLAARAGGFINGQTLVVDGGTMITDGS